MITRSTQFPSVPEDTFLAATALYGKGNLYIRLGDALDAWVGGQLPVEANATFKSHILPALLTIFQYLEELTNDQVLDAVRNRLDLKYILRLPMTAPTMTLKTICEYHRTQFVQPEHQHIMQTLLDRLVEDSYLSHVRLQIKPQVQIKSGGILPFKRAEHIPHPLAHQRLKQAAT